VTRDDAFWAELPAGAFDGRAGEARRPGPGPGSGLHPWDGVLGIAADSQRHGLPPANLRAKTEIPQQAEHLARMSLGLGTVPRW
jgi:hypothetical protein